MIIPFAFLIHNQRDTVLSLLEGMNVDGRSGLDILIQTWCENAETFQGFWPTRISALALCALFASERPSLQNLTVKGDIIVKPETKNGEYISPMLPLLPRARGPGTEASRVHAVIMTRSKTKQSTLPAACNARAGAGTCCD